MASSRDKGGETRRNLEARFLGYLSSLFSELDKVEKDLIEIKESLLVASNSLIEIETRRNNVLKEIDTQMFKIEQERASLKGERDKQLSIINGLKKEELSLIVNISVLESKIRDIRIVVKKSESEKSSFDSLVKARGVLESEIKDRQANITKLGKLIAKEEKSLADKVDAGNKILKKLSSQIKDSEKRAEKAHKDVGPRLEKIDERERILVKREKDFGILAQRLTKKYLDQGQKVRI